MRDYFKYDVIVSFFKNQDSLIFQMCMNITDIEDKIIKKSREAGEEFAAFARKWEIDYFNDMETLNIEQPDVITRVSQFVPEIIEFSEKLLFACPNLMLNILFILILKPI